MPDDASALAIRLLGPLEVSVRGRPIVVDTRKALAIVALVAAEGRPFARDELAAMFWPEADDEAARGALRRTLSSLRTAVKDSGLVIERTQVALDPADSSVDLTELERLAASSRPADLESAAQLARGPFLAGFALRDSPAFDDWQAIRAARVEHAVGALLARLAAARLAAGDTRGAVDASRRRVALDPLDELGQRTLIELLARSGDRTGAIRQYRELVALFDRELGVAPLRETMELYEAVREGRLGQDPTPAIAKRPGATSARGTAAIAPATVLPLVGRDGELASIETAWRASAADGRVVLLEGEAGIGKTRLAETVADAVRADGGIVVAARGYPGETAIAYGPIVEALRSGLAMAGGAARLGAIDDAARREIGRLIDLPSPLRVAGVAASDSASARARLLDAIAAAIDAFVDGPKPGLVWIDDVHLADDSTREALAYLARRLTGRPMLLLLALRREDLTADGLATVDSLARLPDATSHWLRRLDRDEIAAIVRAARPNGADDALIDAFAADSEGLPLHVIAALASGEPPGSAIPRGIQVLLRERMTSVAEISTQILSAAAVIGRSFDLATVREASGRSEEETVDAIEELTRRGIVREVLAGPGSPIRYDFAHGGMRDVVYETTSRARRSLLHRRVADALRNVPISANRDDLARYALIAGHERQAGRLAEAAEAHLEAADRAEAVFANREAIDHLESAIALGHPDRAAAHSRIGELRSRLGEYPAAIASLETAAALAERSALPTIEIALGRVHRRRGDLVAAASHLGSALATDLADSLRARALVERSLVALRAGELDIARNTASEAGSVAARAQDPHLVGVAERLVGLVAHARGDLAGAREALGRSVALAADDADPTASIAALTALALSLAAAGSLEEAVTMAKSAVEACRRIGDRHLEAAVENHIADMLHEAGRAEDSMVHLKRAVALFADVGVEAPGRDPGIWTLAAW